MKTKVIVDVDTGIDDALALALAKNTLGNRVVGVTTCGGNIKLEEALSNTIKIVDLLEWNVPVFAGASKSIEHNEFVHAYDYHGSNGLCDVSLEQKSSPQKISADKFIIESAEKNPQNLTLVCLAAPTNLAKAIIEKPEIADKISAVYIMGGALNVPGNQTEYAEFNFFQDPKSVEIVLSSIKNIFIIPLDVTNKCFIDEEEVLEMKAITPLESFYKEAITNWYRFFGYPKKRKFELYDPLAMSAVTHNILAFKDEKVGINLFGLRQGEIFSNGSHQVAIAYKVDGPRFKKLFLSAMAG